MGGCASRTYFLLLDGCRIRVDVLIRLGIIAGVDDSSLNQPEGGPYKGVPMACSSEVTKAIEALETRLDMIWAHRGVLPLDPRVMPQRNHSVQNFFQEAPAEDEAIQWCPDFAGAPVQEVLIELGLRMSAAVRLDRVNPPEGEEDPLLVKEVVAEFREIRSVVAIVVQAGGAFPGESAETRKNVLSSRAPAPSRAAVEADLDYMIDGISKMQNPPSALVALLPTLKALRAKLHSVLPRRGYRPAPAPQYSDATLRQAWLLVLAHELALVWAVAKASTDRTRFGAIRLLQQRPSTETSSSSSSTSAGTEQKSEAKEDAAEQQHAQAETQAGQTEEAAAPSVSGEPGPVAAGGGAGEKPGEKAEQITRVEATPGGGDAPPPSTGNGTHPGAMETPSPVPRPPDPPC